jgi:hypothetical protein
LQQIGGTESQFEKVMDSLEVIVFLKWNIITPILLVLAVLAFGFRIPEKLAEWFNFKGDIFKGTAITLPLIRLGGQIVRMNADRIVEVKPSSDYQLSEQGPANKAQPTGPSDEVSTLTRHLLGADAQSKPSKL